MVSKRTEMKQRVWAELDERRKRQLAIREKIDRRMARLRAKREANSQVLRDYAAMRIEEVKVRMEAERQQRQHQAQLMSLRRPSIKRGSYVVLTPKMWGKRMTTNGVVSWEASIREWDVFVHRVTRRSRDRYVFVLVSAADMLVLEWNVAAGVHEARAFNAAISRIVGMNFHAG